jgi:PAS domain S-box-containing protein
VGIYILQDNVFKYANPRVLYLFGYALKELESMGIFDLVFKEDQNLVKEYLFSTQTDEVKFHSCEFRAVTKGGMVLYLDGYFAQTIFEGKPAVLGSIIDITNRKNAEDELMRSRKLESIGILAGGIAHDFNNILAIITGYLMMIKESVEENEGLLKIVEKMENASTQAIELSQKLITFSKGGWIFRRKTDVKEVINNAIEAYPDIKPHLKEISIPKNLLPINGDARQLIQVIKNVLQNSDEAMTDPKELKIKAENVVLEENNNLSLLKGNYVKIAVTDNGKGVPRDQLQKIFDPYFTTKDDVTEKGIGLGLAISYSVIKKHKGTISVDSTLGKGTTIHIYIPCFSNTDLE